MALLIRTGRKRQVGHCMPLGSPLDTFASFDFGVLDNVHVCMMTAVLLFHSSTLPSLLFSPFDDTKGLYVA